MWELQGAPPEEGRAAVLMSCVPVGGGTAFPGVLELSASPSMKPETFYGTFAVFPKSGECGGFPLSMTVSPAAV